MREKIIHYIRAGYPGLYLVSPEEQRVESELKSIAKEINFHLHVWSVTAGLLALSVVETKGINAAVIAREKAQAVKKSGILELIETRESLASIGGLDVRVQVPPPAPTSINAL